MMEPMMESLLAILADTGGRQEGTRAKMDANQERMEFNVNAWGMKCRKKRRRPVQKKQRPGEEPTRNEWKPKLRLAW
jgi:hypothetical protein